MNFEYIVFFRIVEISTLSSNSGAAVNLTYPYNRYKSFWSNKLQRFRQRLNQSDGIILNIYHEQSMKLMIRKSFATWNRYAHGLDLASWISQIRNGRIVALTIHRLGSKGLRKTLPILKDYGSVLVPYLPENGLWTWIFVAGGKTLYETATTAVHPRNLTDLFSHSFFIPDNEQRIQYSSENHRLLCNETPIMGRICQSDLNNSVFRRWINENDDISRLKNDKMSVPIVICAGSKPQYLIKSLESLCNIPQIRKEQILIALGTKFPSKIVNENIMQLLKLLNLTYIIIDPGEKQKNVPTNTYIYYRNVFSAALDYFNRSKYISFLDEDNAVSKDWYSLIVHSIPALDIDPTLWCVNPSRGYKLFAPTDTLYRGTTHVGWGYVLRTKDMMSALKIWPKTVVTTTLYDVWLQENVVGKRECIYPGLKRVDHFGVGLNTNPELKERFDFSLPVSNGSVFNFTSVRHLLDNNYNDNMKRKLENAIPLNDDPCTPAFSKYYNLTKDNRTSRDYIYFFRMFLKPNSTQVNYGDWVVLGSCLDIWSLNLDGLYRGVYEMPLKCGTSIFFVGVPYSPFSYIKPENYLVWKAVGDAMVTSEQSEFINSFKPKPRIFPDSYMNETIIL